MKTKAKAYPKGFNIAKMDSFPDSQQESFDEELVKRARTGIQEDLIKKLSAPEGTNKNSHTLLQNDGQLEVIIGIQSKESDKDALSPVRESLGNPSPDATQHRASRLCVSPHQSVGNVGHFHKNKSSFFVQSDQQQ